MQLHYIANTAQASFSGRTIPVIDPSDGQAFDELQRGNAEDITAAVRAARRCYEAVWSKLSAAERGRLLMRLSNKIAEHAEELATLEQRDCGKPTRQARADAVALVRYFEFYAGACDKLHGDTLPYLDGYSVFTWREPHGVTGHIIPWNYPMQIFGRSVGGALAAGNVCVVKPSEDACLSLIRVAQLAAEVGFPAGAINIVTGYGHEVGDALARHEGIDHISFTGSPKARSHWSWAARARRSSLPTRTWTRPFPWSSMRSCRTRARPARPARGCWWSRRSTSRSWNGWARPSKTCASARPPWTSTSAL
jgi:aldehyde dehydrogenase (NAD+)